MGNSQSLDDKECICKTTNASDKWIICDGCLHWFHPSCVSLKNDQFEYILNKNKDWFCDNEDCQLKKEMKAPPKKRSQGEDSCAECAFKAKNNRGLKIHMRKHKRSQSTKTFRMI